MATQIEEWMCQELQNLGIPASRENAQYVIFKRLFCHVNIFNVEFFITCVKQLVNMTFSHTSKMMIVQ